MSETATTRHEVIFPPASFNPRRVFVAGVGAGGSWITLLLAKLGVQRIAICDKQTVAIENVGCGIYGAKHVGMRKVDACREIVELLSAGVQIEAFACGVEEIVRFNADAVFICVDSMKARKFIMLDQCVPQAGGSEGDVKRVFEGRMSAQFFMGHSVDPRAERHLMGWEHYWYPDEEILPGPAACGGHPGTAPTTAMCSASTLVDLFTDWWARERGVAKSAANQFTLDMRTMECSKVCWDPLGTA